MYKVVREYLKDNKFLLLAMFLISINLLYFANECWQMDYRAAFVAVRAFWDGLNPLENNFLQGAQYIDVPNAAANSRFVYPPQALFFYIPITPAGSYFWSKFCFNIFNLFALFGLMLFLKKLHPIRNELVLLIMFSLPVWANFDRGQVYIFITLFLLIAYEYREKIWAGFFPVLAAYLRIFPGIIFLYYLFRKQYKLAVSFLLFGILIFLAGIVVFGPEAFLTFLNNVLFFNNEQWHGVWLNRYTEGYDRGLFPYVSEHLLYFENSKINIFNFIVTDSIKILELTVVLAGAYLFFIRKQKECHLWYYLFLFFIILANSCSYYYGMILYMPFAFYAISRVKEDFPMTLFILLPLYLPLQLQINGIYPSYALAIIVAAVFLIREYILNSKKISEE